MNFNQNAQLAQTSRFYQMHEQWYFKTREQKVLGPYLTIEEAEKQLDVYLAVVEIHKAN